MVSIFCFPARIALLARHARDRGRDRQKNRECDREERTVTHAEV
jgi:hypothetical protein